MLCEENGYLMEKKIDTDYIVQLASAAAKEVNEEMSEIHGRVWDGREDLAKLLISLSSAILVGTVTFSGSLLKVGSDQASCPSLIILSWFLLFLSLSAGLFSLWHSNTLKSFRARFTNSEPDIAREAEQLDPLKAPEDLMPEIMVIIRKYSDLSVQPLGNADKNSSYSLMAALITFGLGVGTFLIFGALQIT